MKNSDVIFLRSLCLAGFFFSPLVALTLYISSASLEFLIPATCYSVFFLCIFVLTCFSSFVRKHAYHMLLAVSCVVSLHSVYFAMKTGYQNFSLLLLALALFCTVLFIQKMSHFICYAACSLTLLIIAVWSNSDAGKKRAFFSLLYMILFTIAFITLKMRFDRENAVTESEKCYRELVENSPEAIVIHHDGNIVYANPAAIKLVAAKNPEELLEKSIRYFIGENYTDAAENQLHQVQFGCMSDPVEIQAKRLDGDTFFCESSLVKGTFNGKPVLISTLKDISKRKLTEQRVRQMAYYDSLTGLPNRRMLYDFLNQALENNSFHFHLGIFFLDIDNFKNINDQYGHDFGDIFLSDASKRIADLLREEDVVYRYGGDEFVIILHKTSGSECTSVATRILNDFSSSFLINGLRVYASVSIGISLYPDDGADAESLLKNADTAMYLAKNSGRNSYRYFSRKSKKPTCN